MNSSEPPSLPRNIEQSSRFARPYRQSLLCAMFVLAAMSPPLQRNLHAGEDKGRAQVEVLFSQDPVENGMNFDRAGAEATQLTVRGKDEEAWIVKNAHSGDPAHRRSFRFVVTDPRFANGDFESIDLEVTYMLDAFGGVRVMMETSEGVKQVGSLWGVTKGNWKTGRVRLNNAVFSRSVDGRADLRLTGENGPLALKSVRITGYHASEDVDWQRMLEIASATPMHPVKEPVFLFHSDSKVGIEYAIRNHAKVAPQMRYEFRIRNDAEEIVHQSNGEISPASQSDTPLPLEFETQGWPYGPYTAEIQFYLDTDREKPAFAAKTLLGVISTTELGKARPGEFLFGLDAGTNPTSPEAFAFYRLMGVDLLRGPGIDSQNPKLSDIRERIDALYAQGVTSILVIDPPGQMQTISEEERQKRLAGIVKNLEEIAHEMKGKVTYYELGNEPDLTFFYPGSIESYHDSFVAMSQAIKRGNPDALVMNGGLCFFGEEGDRRAREFVEIVDMDHLDIWAYHGHGPGAQAERDAYQRQVDAAKKHNKHEIPYLDTETGFSADTPGQARVQSRTGVQKMLFAHKKGMPSLMWFRMFMGESGYSLTSQRIQPKPTVLSYRAMVERLRHARFAGKLADAPEGVEAWLFDEIGAEGAPTGKKTLVTWNEGTGVRMLSLRMDEPGTEIRDATHYDLYGNATPAAVNGGRVSFTVGSEPAYLTWSSPGPISAATVTPSALEATSVPAFLVGDSTPTTWTLRNEESTPMHYEFELTATGSLQLTPSDPKRTGTLAPGASETLQVDIRAAGTAPLPIPRWWHVFGNISPEATADATPADFAKIPSQWPGTSGPVAPLRVWTDKGELDLAVLTQAPQGEKQPAVVFAAIDAPRDMEITLGTAADWWMRWYLNGELLYDTFDRGNNASYTPDSHPFTLPLKKGRNVLAAYILSGSAGFKVVFGSAQDIATIESDGIPSERLEASLSTDGRTLAEQMVAITYFDRLPHFPDLKLDAPLADWLLHEPLAAPGEESVTNFHEAYPDSTRWYGGEADLSAIPWLRQADGDVELIVAVRDDVASVPKEAQADAKAAREYDALVIQGFTSADGEPTTEITLAPTSNGLSLFGIDPSKVQATVDQLDGSLEGIRFVYRIRLPRSAFPHDWLGFTVHDADQGFAKQILRQPPTRVVTD